jgi:hypothetical protein
LICGLRFSFLAGLRWFFLKEYVTSQAGLIYETRRARPDARYDTTSSAVRTSSSGYYLTKVINTLVLLLYVFFSSLLVHSTIFFVISFFGSVRVSIISGECYFHISNNPRNFLQEKAVEDIQQKEQKRKKPNDNQLNKLP